MAEYIDIVSIKEVVSSGALKVEVNEIGNILLIDPRSKESVKIGCLADVEPVRHGRWVDWDVGQGIDIWHKCSECGNGEELISNFYPNCGAKMDGGADSA